MIPPNRFSAALIGILLAATLSHAKPYLSRSLQDGTATATEETETTEQNDAPPSYEMSIASISLTDIETEIPDIVAIHNDKPFEVYANIEWADEIYVESSSNTFSYEMTVDGKVQSTGTVDLNASRALPKALPVGSSSVSQSGTHVIGVKISLDGVVKEDQKDYQSFGKGASFVPLLMVILFASTTQMVSAYLMM